MIGDGRATEAPPCDLLAEGLVLSKMLFAPRLIDRVDLEPLLTAPEHRWIWQALKQTRKSYPEAGAGEFFIAWTEELRRAYPKHWANLIDITLSAGDTESRRADQEYGRGHLDDPMFSHYFHDFDWWLERLRHVHQSRRLISDAQLIAELGWREDVGAARAVAKRMASEGIPTPIRVVIDV